MGSKGFHEFHHHISLEQNNSTLIRASLIEPHTSRVVFVCLFVIDQFTILCGCVHGNCVLWSFILVELKMCELQKILSMVGKMVSC